MKLRIVYAVRAAGVFTLDGRVWAFRWLADTCAGGSWTADERNAESFDSEQEALDALAAAEVSSYADASLEVVRLVQKERG